MNVQAALEALRRTPHDETVLRSIALELGGALPSLSAEDLVQMGTAFARLQAADKDASPWIQGFRSSLSSLLSGARQQRQQAREQRALEREVHALNGMSPRQDWRRLLPAMLQDVIQQKRLAEKLDMQPAQVSRNVNAMREAGLLEEVPVQEHRETAAVHDKRVHLYRLTAKGRQMAELLASKEEAQALANSAKPVQRHTRWHDKARAPNSWCNASPGASTGKGISRWKGRRIGYKSAPVQDAPAHLQQEGER